MDRHRRRPSAAGSPPSSPPRPLLRDVSNFKTPRRLLSSPSPSPLFFTACKNTSSLRRCPSAARSAASRRLKALEIEQSKSSRKVQIQREEALKSFANAAAAWLNLLFSDPKSCGCDPNFGLTGDAGRGSLDGGRWRSPKRQKNHGKRIRRSELTPEAAAKLKASMKDVCSYDDIKERMDMYMTQQSRNDVLLMMSQVCKNIDEGRLRMKGQCPIVTDLARKEKAMAILLCYNPTWLRVGLHVVLGGDSLLVNEGENQEQESLLLSMIIEKQFLAHTTMAKCYAYNRLVEGLYRPGYFECLGNLILKRFLLLVIILDQAKSEGTLPLKYGIDGIDGGSPLLFRQDSHIKSSRQMIHEFLLESMYGEGDLLQHLSTMGCKVNHQQLPLVECNFKISNLFEDLRDGLLLCRAIHLLQQDSSILQKVVAPSDTHKKNLQNCNVAIQYLRQVGVPLCDEDGVLIAADDLANGDKDLVLSFLWNLFLHLQAPLLISRTSLVGEIFKVKESHVEDQKDKSYMNLIADWIQAICESDNLKINNVSYLCDGKALCCLLHHYFRSKLSECDSSKYIQFEDMLSDIRKSTSVRNLSFIQDVATKLWNLPEILQVSDFSDKEEKHDDRTFGMLAIFLASKLINRKNMDLSTILSVARSFYRAYESKCSEAPLSAASVSRKQNIAMLHKDDVLNFESPLKKTPESAVKVIQFLFRGVIQRKKFLKMKRAALLLQAVTRAWLRVKSGDLVKIAAAVVAYPNSSSGTFNRYHSYMVDRHRFARVKRSVLLIQRALRYWVQRRHEKDETALPHVSLSFVAKVFDTSKVYPHYPKLPETARFIQHKEDRDDIEALGKQSCAGITIHLSSATVIIQRYWRCFCSRRKFLLQVQAIIKIQAGIRLFILHKNFKNCIQAATTIQCFIRGQIARRRLLGSSSVANMLDTAKVQSDYPDEVKMPETACLLMQQKQECYDAETPGKQVSIGTIIDVSSATMIIQSHWRSFCIRRRFLFHVEAIIRIQAGIRLFICQKNFKDCIQAAATFQCFIRGQIARRRLLASSFVAIDTAKVQPDYPDEVKLPETTCLLFQHKQECYGVENLGNIIDISSAAMIIQSNWRSFCIRRRFLLHVQAIMEIQAGIRLFVCQKNFMNCIQAATCFQCFIRGQIARRRLLGSSQHRLRKHYYPQSKITITIRPQDELQILIGSVIKVQRWWRKLLLHKSRESTSILIQACIRGWFARKLYNQQRMSIYIIQRWWRKVQYLELRRTSVLKIQAHVRGWIARRTALRILQGIITVQAHIRGWNVRRAALRNLHHIVIVQTYWRGYIARKGTTTEIAQLRCRLHNSNARIDDKMRLINRLSAALSDLHSMKSISSIRHICQTFSMVTSHSQKCCEELVAAGAIDILLEQFHSLNRGGPDQEVIKHILSTLRNIARYPQYRELFSNTRSVEIIITELLRNKSEGFFIACEILKLVCSKQQGLHTVRKLANHIKRLKILAQDFERKAELQKRNPCFAAARDTIMQRWREIVSLLHLIDDNNQP